MNDQGTESNSIASTVLGIVSLVISIIGGLTFGIIGAAIEIGRAHV